MIIIGVVGKLGAGKDTLVDYLRDKHGFHKVSTGDLVRELAKHEGASHTRGNLQDVAMEIRRRRGEDYLAGVVIGRIEQNDWKRVGITGLRTPTDVKTLKHRFGEAFTLVRVEAQDPRARFHRGVERDKPRDADSYAEFLQSEATEVELFDLDQTLAMADILIRNDGTLEEFHQRIEDEFVRVFLHKS